MVLDMQEEMEKIREEFADDIVSVRRIRGTAVLFFLICVQGIVLSLILTLKGYGLHAAVVSVLVCILGFYNFKRTMRAEKAARRIENAWHQLLPSADIYAPTGQKIEIVDIDPIAERVRYRVLNERGTKKIGLSWLLKVNAAVAR